jgi:hypothetical protein
LQTLPDGCVVKLFKRLLIIVALMIVLCLPPVTYVMPDPFKTAFTGVRENMLTLAKGEGYGHPSFKLPRGAWQMEGGSGVEHVGGR